ncbi:MAG TPA: hypothetical protein VFQ54_07450, partial [Thermomicrobiales bacterium]|nr:hypothetical protein [Thermomicrobiales bacterium]
MSRLRPLMTIVTIVMLWLGSFSGIAVAQGSSPPDLPAQAALADNPTPASDTVDLPTDVPPPTDAPTEEAAPTDVVVPTEASQPTSEVTPTEAATSTATLTPAPTGTAAAGSVVVQAHLCPATIAVADAAGSDLATACTGDAGGTVFDLAGNLGATASQTVGASDGVEFDDLPADNYTITQEDAPSDSSLAVFCAAGTDGQSQQLEVDRGAIAFDLADQAQQVCDWYIGGATPVATANATATASGTPGLQAKNLPGTGSLQIKVYGCPEGYTQDSPDPSGLARFCVVPMPGVGFTTFSNFTSTGTLHQGSTTGSPSFVKFDGLPTGTLSIREVFPAGYTSAVVFCRAEGTPAVAYAQYPAASGGDHTNVYWGNLGEQDVSCDWYNIPALTTAENGTVYVNLNGCPTGFPADTV